MTCSLLQQACPTQQGISIPCVQLSEGALWSNLGNIKSWKLWGAALALWRACKPGGLLVVTVPACPWLWGEHDEINDHKRRYTRAALRQCLAQPDSEWLRMSYMNTLLAPPVMVGRPLWRFFRKFRARSGEPRSDIFNVPAVANECLAGLFGAESHWLVRHGLPFGVSLVAVLRRKSKTAVVSRP